MTRLRPEAGAMRIHAIVVPRGAEARAVERGWQAPCPPLLRIPAGASAARELATGAPIETALVLGLCGALDPALRVSEPVVYGQIVDAERTIELDPQLTAACAVALQCTTVRAANVANVVGNVAQKAALRAATGAGTIDMEAVAIARALSARGVRVAMVRVVSDDAHSELPDLRDVYDTDGRLRPTALALALARRPQRGVHFIRNALFALAALRSTAERLSRF